MDKKETTFGLSTEDLIKLFEIGSDTRRLHGDADTEEQKSMLLNDWLAKPLASGLPGSEVLPNRQSALGHTIWALSGEAIGKLLGDSATDIKYIRKIKDYGRRLSTRSTSEIEHHVANTVYYAAIAHALVFHSEKITSFSDMDLKKAFDRLSQEGWIPGWLVELLVEAARQCHSKT